MQHDVQDERLMVLVHRTQGEQLMTNEKGARSEHGPTSGDDFAYYPLPGLLPDGHMLALNTQLDLLSHLAPAETTRWPRLLVQEHFTANEIHLLVPLLDNYPGYCPYEAIWASFTTGRITEETLARARLRLQEAHFAGVRDYEMKPLRNVLSRVRLKLRRFHIEVRSIIEVGYLLKPLAREELPERNLRLYPSPLSQRPRES